MKIIIAGFILIVTLAGLPPLQAQEEDPNAWIAKAELVEAQEGNLTLAYELLDRASRTTNLSETSRAEVFYKKALLEQKLGRLDAAKQSLMAATKGTGDFSERAKSLLKGGLSSQEEPADWQISGRVHRAISKLYNNETSRNGINELGLIGDTAVPALAEAMKNEKTDIGFVGRGVEAMLQIGGPRVAKWFAAVVTDPDIIYRRTVMNSFEMEVSAKGAGRIQSLEVAPQLGVLLQDQDIDVAAGACRILGTMRVDIDPEVYLGLLERADAGTLTRLLPRLYTMSVRSRVVDDPVLRERLLSDFVEFFKIDNENLRDLIRRQVELMGSDQPATAADFWFELQTRLTAEDHLGQEDVNTRYQPPAEYQLHRALPWLKKLPQAEFEIWHRSGRRTRESRIGTMAVVMERIAQHEKANCAPALETIELLGPSPLLHRIEQVVAQTGGPELVVPALAAIDSFNHPEYIGWLLQRHQVQLTAAELAPIFAWFRRAAESESELGQFIQGPIGQMVQSVAYLRTPQALAGLMALVDFDARFFMAVAERLTKLEIPEALPHLVTLLSRKDEGALADAARHLVFQKLMESGYQPALAALAAAPQAGLRYTENYQVDGKSRTYPAPSPQNFGLRGLDDFANNWRPEDLVTITSALLDADLEAHAPGLIEWYRDRKGFYSRNGPGEMPKEVRALIEKRVFDLPATIRDEILEQILKKPAAIVDYDALFAQAVRHPDPKIASEAIDSLPVPFSELAQQQLHQIMTDDSLRQLRREALKTIARSGDQDFWPDALAALDDEDEWVRWYAADAMLSIDEERALPLILKLAKDRSSSVRSYLCKALGLRPNRQSVPVLIELLRDEVEFVRTGADKSLRQIEFYFEQKDRWEKWLQGAGFTSVDAAGALLEQAAPGQPQAQRIVAIQSLATLAVPETLPILIGWMTDADAEIAAAAKAAVAKINGN